MGKLRALSGAFRPIVVEFISLTILQIFCCNHTQRKYQIRIRNPHESRKKASIDHKPWQNVALKIIIFNRGMF